MHVIIPDETQYAFKIDATGKMLGIVVDDHSLEIFCRMLHGIGKQPHRICVERICLAVKLDQSKILWQGEVARFVFFNQGLELAPLCA